MPTINKKSIGVKSFRLPQLKEAVDAGRETANAVYNTRMWGRLRKARLMEHPLCEKCGKNLSVEVHHIVPIPRNADLLTAKTVGFDLNNLIALCRECHSAQHKNNRHNG